METTDVGTGVAIEILQVWRLDTLEEALGFGVSLDSDCGGECSVKECLRGRTVQVAQPQVSLTLQWARETAQIATGWHQHSPLVAPRPTAYCGPNHSPAARVVPQ